MEKKKVEEWLLGLPPGYSNRALENMHTVSRYSPSSMTTSMSDAINRGFTWDKTPEGDTFWNDIYRKYYRHEQDHPEQEFDVTTLPPIPEPKALKKK